MCVCVLTCWVHVLERDRQKREGRGRGGGGSGGGDREKQLCVMEVRTRHVQCKMQCTQRAVLARVGGLSNIMARSVEKESPR